MVLASSAEQRDRDRRPRGATAPGFAAVKVTTGLQLAKMCNEISRRQSSHVSEPGKGEGVTPSVSAMHCWEIPSARCSWLISAHSSTVIMPPICPIGVAQFSTVATGSVFDRR